LEFLGSRSSSKLVYDDDPYPDPYPPPRPFIRSRNVDEDADDEEYDPAVVLDLDDSSERRGSGSGGTSGTSVRDDDEGPPWKDDMLAIERCARTERACAARRGAGVGAGEGVLR